MDVTERKCGSVLKQFLTETAMVYDLKEGLRNFYKKMMNI